MKIDRIRKHIQEKYGNDYDIIQSDWNGDPTAILRYKKKLFCIVNLKLKYSIIEEAFDIAVESRLNKE